MAVHGLWTVHHRVRTAFVEEERSREPGKGPAGERETVSRSRCGHDNPNRRLAMNENDYDVDNMTHDELLAEIGLDSYTIRRLKSEAAHPEAGGGGEELS